MSRRHGAGSERQTSVHRDAGDVERALDVMREALTDWQGMLRQETGPARRAMQALLKGRLAFTPQERDGERFYTFEGEGTIFTGNRWRGGSAKGVVAPTGFEPVFESRSRFR